MQAVAKHVAENGRHRQKPMAGFRPSGAQAPEQILDELRAVNRLLTEKTTPEETFQFREWLRSAAQRAATAAEEGRFMGLELRARQRRRAADARAAGRDLQ
jgi:hypothetical protein